MAQIINWTAALFFALAGALLALRCMDGVIDDVDVDYSIRDALKFWSNEILIATLCLGLGVHFILHLTGAY